MYGYRFLLPPSFVTEQGLDSSQSCLLTSYEIVVFWLSNKLLFQNPQFAISVFSDCSFSANQFHL